jgi:hypothetical protein
VVSGVCVWITILQAVVNQNYSLTWISKYFRYLSFIPKMTCSNKTMNICENVIILLGSICVNFLLYTNNVVENQGGNIYIYIYIHIYIYTACIDVSLFICIYVCICIDICICIVYTCITAYTYRCILYIYIFIYDNK